MGVYIKGMEMPTSCANCDLAKHFDGYNENDCPFNCFSYYDCLLVPVPPHGRLIDADAVSLEGGPYEYDEWCKWALEQYQDAPTVIPASKGDK